MKITTTTSNDGRPYSKLSTVISWAIPGDIHIPFHDELALSTYLKSCCLSDGVIITGDLIDYYWLSSWPKDAKITTNAGFKKTRDALIKLVAQLSDFKTVIYGCGNHEARVASLSRKFPGFDGEWFWMFKDVIPTSWIMLDHGYRLELAQKTPNGLPIIVEHGDKAQYGGVVSADKLVNNYPGQCTIVGHNHRVQSAAKTTWKKGKATTTTAFTAGHLSDIVKNNYAANPNWQHGGVEVYSDGLITTTLIVNGKVL